MKKNKALIIKELKTSRGKQQWYLINFLNNLARFARLMHYCLKQFRNDKSLIEEAKRNYVISIATSLETFYRDLFIYTLEKDENILKKLLPQISDKFKLDEMHEFYQQDISFPEIVASNFSFQSLEEIDFSISKLFSSENYLNTLSSFEPILFIPSKGSERMKLKLPDQWQKYLKEIFLKRHAFAQ